LIYLLKNEPLHTGYLMWYSLFMSKNVTFKTIENPEEVDNGSLVLPILENEVIRNKIKGLLHRGIKLITSDKCFYPEKIIRRDELFVRGTILNSSVLFINNKVFRSLFPGMVRIYYNKIRRRLLNEYVPLSLWEIFYERSDEIFLDFSGDDYERKNLWPDGYDTAFCLSFDCDYKRDFEAFERTCNILMEHKIPASFAVIGKAIEEYMDVHKKISTELFEIINHTYSHPDNEVYNKTRFIDMDHETKKYEVSKAQAVIQDLLKFMPAGFRTPHFGYNVDMALFELLEEQDFIYDSSIISNNTPGLGNPYYPDKQDFRMESEDHFKTMVLPVSACPACGSSFDTWHSIRSPHAIHRDPVKYREIWKRLIDQSIERKTLINTYVDPQDFIKEEYLPVFEWVFDYIKSKKIWITRMDEVAKWFASKNTPDIICIRKKKG
jgi:peptidoglycan/xylan/chitin deacetylase (PgdA/CDA1 family)